MKRLIYNLVPTFVLPLTFQKYILYIVIFNGIILKDDDNDSRIISICFFQTLSISFSFLITCHITFLRACRKLELKNITRY